MAYREAQAAVSIRDLEYQAWSENYAAGTDLKLANAAPITAELAVFAGKLASAYLKFQTTLYSVKADFYYYRQISQLNTYLATGSKLAAAVGTALGSGQTSIPDVPNLLNTISFARQLANDLLGALVDKEDLTQWNLFSGGVGTAVDVLNAILTALQIGTDVLTAIDDTNASNGNIDLARSTYIMAAARAEIAIENYDWQLEHCTDNDPKVNSPGEVPLPGFLGGSTTKVGVAGPSDPNDLTGPAGFGPQGFIQPETMPFEVDFENDPAKATAAAQVVTATMTLDPNLDPGTFQFTGFGFGAYNFTVPAGLSDYSTTIDLRPDGVDLLVPVSLDLNQATGVVMVTFQSLDPATMEPPQGINAGFLPVDDAEHDGEGYFTFTAQPKAGLPTGTKISAQASIVFDTNAAIATPATLNTLDVGAPTSSVAALPATEKAPTFTVSWSGSDDTGGSGIAFYDVFVSDNGGPYVPFLTATTATSASFQGVAGHTYAFYSVATDNVGNRQPTRAAAQATTFVDGAPNSAVKALTGHNVDRQLHRELERLARARRDEHHLV